MSGFGDSEASEVSTDLSAEDSEAEIVNKRRKKDSKKSKKSKRKAIHSSDDSSAEDDIADEEELLRKEGQGWIVDEDDREENEGEADAANASDDEEEEEDLTDDDFDLIQENVGVNLKRPKKKRRIVVDDDEPGEDSRRHRRDDGREEVARQIFTDDSEDESDGEPKARAPHETPAFDINARGDDFEEDDGEPDDEDDMNDFIVDDRAGRDAAQHQRRTFVHKDAALQEAQEIFGVDFDLAQFERDAELPLGEESVPLAEESDEYESESDGELGDRAAIRRARRLPKKVLEKQVQEMFDPSELDRAYFSQADEKIRKTDLPERFQLRRTPVKQLSDPPTQAELQELQNEADWIFQQAFKPTEGQSAPSAESKPNVLKCLRLLHEGLEVPFIAFYRKESMGEELGVNDLWTIYEYDEKWASLQRSKASLVKVLQRLVDYFDAQENAEDNKQSALRLITLARNAESPEEVKDVREYYTLHFLQLTDTVRQWEKQNKKKDANGVSGGAEEEEAGLGGAEEEEDREVERERHQLTRSIITMTIDPHTGRQIKQKRARTTAAYDLADRANMGELVKRFGLSASQFAQNVNDQYVRNEVDQCPMLPLDAARDFECPQFPTAEGALRAARYMLAFQMSREPAVRRLARQMLADQTVVDIHATKRGVNEIDENHPLYTVAFIREKPYRELLANPIYLHIHNGVKDELIEMKLSQYEVHGCTLLDELTRFFTRDEFSSLVQAWNEQRQLVLKEVLDKFLLPQLFEEIREKLLKSARRAVLKACAIKMFNHLNMAPYTSSAATDEADTDDKDSVRGRKDHRRGVGGGGGLNSDNGVWPRLARVMAIAIKEPDASHAPHCTAVQLNCHGEVLDFIHAPGVLVPEKNQRLDLNEQKAKDVDRLSSFIARNAPEVIVLGCDCRRVLRLRDRLTQMCDELYTERRLATRVKIELLDTELAYVFAHSKKANAEIASAAHTEMVRVAISLGRRLQDPLAEFSQLMNYDQEVLGLRLHQLQDCVPKDMLLSALEEVFINRVNEIGVDLNRCLDQEHTASLLQFVAGFGPRKALHLLKHMRHHQIRMTHRMQLVTVFELGPRVVMNCAGFLKIDTAQVRDLDTDDVEILDSTRVHPESYDLAKKMAVDALEYDDTEEVNPTDALDEIVQTPQRLRELDLDAFAEELKRQGHGDKHITLYDIRRELNNRYKDLRNPWEPPNDEEVFSMVTRETPLTLHVGKLIECKVHNVVTKRPRPDQLDNANPQRSETTGWWKCPFCQEDNFQQLSMVWGHFDSDECPGQPVGLQVELENGISGFIPLKMTDPPTEEFLERYPPGSMILTRVTKIDIMRFSVELTARQVALEDERNLFRPHRDQYYDHDEEKRMLKSIKEEEEKEAAKRQKNPYISRVIFHPNFENISFQQLCIREATIETGDVIIRPSSKGPDHLTLSWKVDSGILRHFDILEKEKAADFDLGKKLFIEKEEFDDLDEIIARFVQPMSSLLLEVMSYKNYRDSKGGDKEVLAQLLRKEKEATPARIPYFFSTTRKYPGHIILAYMPGSHPDFEYILITPEGFRFRRSVFPNLDRLLAWFKEHYNDPEFIKRRQLQMQQAQVARNAAVPRPPSGEEKREHTRHARSPGGAAGSPVNMVTRTPSGRTPAVGGSPWIRSSSGRTPSRGSDDMVTNTPDMSSSHNRTPSHHSDTKQFSTPRSRQTPV